MANFDTKKFSADTGTEISNYTEYTWDVSNTNPVYG